MSGGIDDEWERPICPWCKRPTLTLNAAPNVLVRHNTDAPWQPHPTIPGVRVPTKCPGSGATIRRPEPS